MTHPHVCHDSIIQGLQKHIANDLFVAGGAGMCVCACVCVCVCMYVVCACVILARVCLCVCKCAREKILETQNINKNHQKNTDAWYINEEEGRCQV